MTTNDIRFESIEVLPVKAETVDIRNMDYIRSNESTDFPNVTFLVKLNIAGEIPHDSCGIDLYIDDYNVKKFNQWNNGVFFKVYNPRFLTKHSGKEIFYSIGGNKKKSTGINFPNISDQSAIDKITDISSEYPLAENLLN